MHEKRGGPEKAMHYNGGGSCVIMLYKITEILRAF